MTHDLHNPGTDRLLAAVKACDHVSSREYRAALERQKPALAQWNRVARERILKDRLDRAEQPS